MTEGDRGVRVGITGVAARLPERLVTGREVEERVARSGGGHRPTPGIVERMTGIRTRHLADDDRQASDLAVAAARRLLDERGLGPADVDLLIFGSASQDLVEPATAHIVSSKLGTRCPVFDVTNACNSFLNAVQIAEALIRTGQHTRVLVCTGEVPSRAVRWRVRDFRQFVEAFPGYTLSDGGAAVLLEPVARGGVFHRAFEADSSAWDVGTLPGGGTMHPRDPEYTYFHADGRRLKDAFVSVGTGLFDKALAETGLRWDDFAVVCVHQVAMAYLDELRERTGIPADRLVVTLPEHGNLASATLPFQLATAMGEGRCGPGDKVALLGLGGGVSLGVVFVEL
ncbi:3-oxoacyl-ACP synthase III family protein [Thermomonospora umbrina]|uniref:3-oxoacyl-[acyl-carrier-protein] synthase-3 n=1 Tax=Thermomonospora umbrina TaxID=111806 RepID=A0A3D9SFN9_9ACTN|nr:ketoacyl-ACP synthase III [Thermomonospora umbrina]REE94709.1 3-oxoacyl-[acyl-carrier-protein] synthase-3 [Thermomonospora umbrina]